MEISKEQAIISASICSGESGIKLIESLTTDNIISKRTMFLNNVAYNGARSHNHIINVLQYMKKFIITL